MNHYWWLKTVHIVSSTVLFGTGLGTAYALWMAHRTRDARVIAAVARHTVTADWVFTAPAVLLQPATGFALAWLVGYPVDTPWIVAASVLYLIAGACWIPVVVIQYRVRRIALDAAAGGVALPAEYERLMRRWFALGWPAFLALVATFWLMVRRPPLWT